MQVDFSILAYQTFEEKLMSLVGSKTHRKYQLSHQKHHASPNKVICDVPGKRNIWCLNCGDAERQAMGTVVVTQ